MQARQDNEKLSTHFPPPGGFFRQTRRVVYETIPAMQAEIKVETAPHMQAEKERRAMASARSGAKVKNKEIWVPIDPMLANEAMA